MVELGLGLGQARARLVLARRAHAAGVQRNRHLQADHALFGAVAGRADLGIAGELLAAVAGHQLQGRRQRQRGLAHLLLGALLAGLGQLQLGVLARRAGQPVLQRADLRRAVARQRQRRIARLTADQVGQRLAPQVQFGLRGQVLGAQTGGPRAGLVQVGDRQAAHLEALGGLAGGALHRLELAFQQFEATGGERQLEIVFGAAQHQLLLGADPGQLGGVGLDAQLPALGRAFAVEQRLAQHHAVVAAGAAVDLRVEGRVVEGAQGGLGKGCPACLVVQRGGSHPALQHQVRAPQGAGLILAGQAGGMRGAGGGKLGVMLAGGAPDLEQVQGLGRWRCQRRAAQQQGGQAGQLHGGLP